MSDGSGYVVSNTGIWNNNNCISTQWYIKNDFIKFVNVSSSVFFIFVVCLMKWKLTRENVY